MTPLGVLAMAFGLWLWLGYGFSRWLAACQNHAGRLAGRYHWHCGRMLRSFRPAAMPSRMSGSASTMKCRCWSCLRPLSRRPEAFLMNKYFAICPRGLEELLHEELRPSARRSSGNPRRCLFSGDWTLCYRANLESRMATRILWHIVKGPVRQGRGHLPLAVRQLWPNHFDVSRTMRVVTTAIKCPLKSLDFRDVARQGCRLRPLPRRPRRAAEYRDAQPGCQRSCLS
jgi:hypothetical protein